MYSANRLMRWATILLGYDFDIEYVNTTKFGQADGLLRLMQTHRAADEVVVIAAAEGDVSSVLQGCIRKLPVTHEDVELWTEENVVEQDYGMCETWKIAKGGS